MQKQSAAVWARSVEAAAPARSAPPKNCLRFIIVLLHKAKLWQRINPNPVNERQRKVINLMLDNFKGHLTTSKYAKLAKCSTDTALRAERNGLAESYYEAVEAINPMRQRRLPFPCSRKTSE